ncbi:MAG: HAMP domain-containing histidine kinase, partial [Sulfurimonas sp.]|nr:HAMP domain-containing histidine kinase [Sulfurimonas sp.]
WKKRLGFKEDEKPEYIDYLSLIEENNRFKHHLAMHDLIELHQNTPKYVHFRIRYPLVTKYGEKLMIEDVGDIFFDGGEPIHITGFHRDITEQERQLKIIESQNRISAMGDMMSNVAHQWRQPIGAINNTLNDIEFDIELDDMKNLDVKVFLETSTRIKSYTSYLSQTIEDFRKLSSDEKQKSNFMPRHTIEQAYNISKNEFIKNNISFHIVESGNIPCEINGYDRELQQVVINILNNAKDILIERKIDNPTVTISIINTKSDITIIIHDNAGGIPDSILEKIFDPYFTTKHESIGTGIGLYMSKKIILEYFNGSIEVENENNGAKFSIILPKN